MLGAEEWERVEAGLALAMGDPCTRRIIMCGMIPTARGMTASVLSEVARRIDRKWRGKAQEWMKESGTAQPMESVQSVLAAKGCVCKSVVGDVVNFTGCIAIVADNNFIV